MPPQARELENAVLGAIMLEKDAFDEVNAILKPETFYSEANQKIFAAMQSLAKNNSPIDMLTVVEELNRMKELDNVGGPFYLVKCTNVVVSSANIITHAKIVFQKFLSREMIRLSSSMLAMAYDETEDIFELIDRSETELSEIGMKNLQGDMVHISDEIPKALNQIREWMKNESDITGVTSGFPQLDKATRGWQGGDLIILGARPSVGKTAFALNLIISAAESGITIGVWSLEMKVMFLLFRILSSKSKIYLHKLQTGKLDEDEMKMLEDKIAAGLRNLPIYFDDSNSVNLQAITRKARRLKKKKKLGMIFIDYLQLMSGEGKTGNREQEISKISRGLKNLAQELNIPIIALSQLSREEGSKNISWDNGPKASALRESGAIEQDADVVIMLWGPSDDDIKKDYNLVNRRKVRIVKQRNGMLITEELEFKNEIQVFEAISNSSFSAGNWQPVPKDVRNYLDNDSTDDNNDEPF